MDWYPAKLFSDRQPQRPYVVLILNQPVNVQAYRRVAPHASMLVCVDGGANQWQRIIDAGRPPFDRFPDAVVGDLDSLNDDVRHFLASKGRTTIVRDSDQESTDFTKALRWLQSHEARDLGGRKQGEVVDVVAFGGLGGRVDQAFSLIHHLFKATDDPDLLQGDMYLLSSQNLSFVLRRGHNIIAGLSPEVSADKHFTENVGIIPIQGPATISTTGLEWDVSDWRTEFGGRLSTSNHVRSDRVEIKVSNPLLFTIELAEPLRAQ